ncbi:MAG: T9SS type A sorting domain-containing protein [Bacteroidota bacterium]
MKYFKKAFMLCLTILILSNNQAAAQWVKSFQIPTEEMVAFASVNDTLFVASGNNKIYKSVDGGLNWELIIVTNQLIKICSMNSIDGVIYLGTFAHGIYSSVNSGATWQHSNIESFPVSCIVKNENKLYASTIGAGVFAFNENTNTWQPFNDSLHAVNIEAILSTPTSLLAAGGGNGVFSRLNKNTKRWAYEYFYGNLMPGLIMQKMIQDSIKIFAVNGKRIITSNNDGLSWAEDKEDARNGVDRTIFNGTKNYYIASNLVGGGTWIQQRNKHDSIGSTWANKEEFIEDGYVYDIFELNDLLFLAKADGLYTKQLALSIDEPKDILKEIAIYPNPVIDNNIKISNIQGFQTAIVLNTLGEVLYTKVLDSNNTTISLNLAKGLYFISLEDEHRNSITKKIIVE